MDHGFASYSGKTLTLRALGHGFETTPIVGWAAIASFGSSIIRAAGPLDTHDLGFLVAGPHGCVKAVKTALACSGLSAL